jgi:hypothetical protein
MNRSAVWGFSIAVWGGLSRWGAAWVWVVHLGIRPIDFPSQNRTVAAREMADGKDLGASPPKRFDLPKATKKELPSLCGRFFRVNFEGSADCQRRLL